MKELDFNLLIEAISYWLGYQSKIGRQHLIHEASIRYPMADALTARNVNMAQIALEYKHPVFANRKVDLFIEDGSKSVFEFKMAKPEIASSTAEIQRIFNDLLRLAYCSRNDYQNCYFLIFGTYEYFKSFFVGQGVKPTEGNGKKNIVPPKVNSSKLLTEQQWTPQGLYAEWFDFKIDGMKQMALTQNDQYLKTFNETYKTSDAMNEVKLQTICRAITPSGSEHSRTHAVGIWQVKHIQ